jgi:hypothetical protein
MPTTTGSGQIVMNAGDVPKPQPIQLPKLSGSIAQVAAAKTAGDAAQAAAAYKELGAGQKGSGRTRKGRGRRLRGGAEQTVQPSNLPSAGSIPGISATGVGAGLTNLKAQIGASASYDKLAGAQPRTVGGRRRGGFLLRGAEELYPGSGSQEDTKRKRKTKKKHGRRHNRTHRRKHSRRHTVRRRGGRRV